MWTVISLNKSISHESWAHIITDFDNWMLEREDERFFSLRVPPPTDHEGPRTDWQTDWQMVCVITRAHSPTNRKWIASRCKVVDSALNLGTCHKRTCHRYIRRFRKTLEWKSIEFIYITCCQENLAMHSSSYLFRSSFLTKNINTLATFKNMHEKRKKEKKSKKGNNIFECLCEKYRCD